LDNGIKYALTKYIGGCGGGTVALKLNEIGRFEKPRPVLLFRSRPLPLLGIECAREFMS
jgi:hypothetical protein